MAHKANSLSHTKWYCTYHIVFTPKYRRKEIYGQYRKDLKEIIKELCRYKGGGNRRRTLHAWPCASSSRDSSKAKHKLVHGIPEGKVSADDVWQTCKPEVQVRQQTFLVRRILCVDSRAEYSNCGEIYPRAGDAWPDGGQAVCQGIRRSIFKRNEEKKKQKK